MNKKRLTLSEWASIAEVIGAIGVVISLIYVGIQVSENTDEIRATNRQQLIGRAHSATNRIASSPDLSQAISNLVNGDPLTPSQQIQYGFFVRGMVYDVQEAFLLHQEGRLDEAYWKTRSALIVSYMTQDLARGIYIRDKALGLLHEDFVLWADQVLEIDADN
jgi:hypothetical protein